MMKGCKKYGLSEPVIPEEQSGISVSFLKDVYTEEPFDLSDRQIRAILYIKECRNYGRHISGY